MTSATVLKRGLIVSCQAYEGDPLFGAPIMAAMARAAEVGGAVGIRANSPADIAAIRAITSLPLIGLHKLYDPVSPVYITPTLEAAASIVRAGCDVVALDATDRARPGGLTLAEQIRFVHDELQRPVLADVSCLDDAVMAEACGADYLSTTLAGYVPGGRPPTDGPDLALVASLVGRCGRPVLAEGRFQAPDEVAQAFALGAYAVVVGGAITRPEAITRRLVAAVPPAVPPAVPRDPNGAD